MARWLLRAATGLVITFLYLPIATIALYAFNAQRIQVWPIKEFSTQWFGAAWDNPSVRDALGLSIQVGLLAALIVYGRRTHQHAVAQRPFRKIAGHGASPGTRTFWPGLSACTPAVTTTSPAWRPPVMVTPSSRYWPISTGEIATLPFAGS